MNRFVLFLLFSLATVALSAQGLVRGRVLDKQTEEALSFVNVKVLQKGSDVFVKGTVTDSDGKFLIEGLKNGQYTVTFTFVGYKTIERQVTISDKNKTVSYPAVFMSEDAHALKEVTVTGQKSSMKLEVDRKSFDVSQLVTNVGQTASEALENIPSVEVDNDGNVSLRGNSSVEVWIDLQTLSQFDQFVEVEDTHVMVFICKRMGDIVWQIVDCHNMIPKFVSLFNHRH